jgi:hypothetical protein
LALVAGIGLGYVGIFEPLRASRAGEEVSVYLSAAAVTPLALFLGVAYTLFPAGAERLLGHPQRPTRLGRIVGLAIGAAGLLVYLWLRSEIRARGYEFR